MLSVLFCLTQTACEGGIYGSGTGSGGLYDNSQNHGENSILGHKGTDLLGDGGSASLGQDQDSSEGDEAVNPYLRTAVYTFSDPALTRSV